MTLAPTTNATLTPVHAPPSLSCDNCHSHVARSLNEMEYGNSTSWNMVTLCFWMLFSGKWVSFGRFLQTWAPFLVIVAIIVIVKFVL